MEPWISWTLAVCVGTGLFLYYRNGTKSKAPQANARRPGKPQQEPTDSQVTGAASSVEAGSSKKRKSSKTPQERSKPAQPVQPVVPAPSQKIVEAVEDDADNDKAWAQQLSAAQKGVNLNKAANANGDAAPRAKGGKKAKRPEEVKDTAAWPTELEVSSKNVDDMLEPVAPGPSVLRLTGEEKAKKQVPKKAEPEQETKKQRQNRRKAEEKKAAREQDEQERKVLLENQRRTAREARGEPAKNGVPVPAAPTSSPWTKANATGKASQTAGEAQLLDTFDHEAASATSSNEPHTSTTTPATSASTLDAYEQSEEAQLEMIAQLDENMGWNEVGKVKKGKKKTTVGSPPAEAGVKEVPTPSAAAPATVTSPPPELPVKPVKPANGAAKEKLVTAATPAAGLPVKAAKPTNTYDMLSSASSFPAGEGPRHPMDSDWLAD